MTIYKIEANFENILSINIDPVSMAQRMPEYRPRPLVKEMKTYWKAPEASFYASQSAKNEDPRPDISNCSLAFLTLNKKALNALEDLLSPSGEILPLDFPEEELFLFNPLYIVKEEALDRSKEIAELDTGVYIGEKNVSVIEEQLEGHKVFRLPTDKLISAYCTEGFRSKVVESSLIGLNFEPLNV